MSCKYLTVRRMKEALVPDSLVYLGVVLFTVKVELSMQDLFPVPELLDNGMAAAAVLVMLFCAVKDWNSPREMTLCAMGLGIIALAAVRLSFGKTKKCGSECDAPFLGSYGHCGK